MKKYLVILFTLIFISLGNAQKRASIHFHEDGKTYQENTLVSVDGNIYRAVQTTSTNPVGSRDWQQVGADQEIPQTPTAQNGVNYNPFENEYVLGGPLNRQTTIETGNSEIFIGNTESAEGSTFLSSGLEISNNGNLINILGNQSSSSLLFVNGRVELSNSTGSFSLPANNLSSTGTKISGRNITLNSETGLYQFRTDNFTSGRLDLDFTNLTTGFTRNVKFQDSDGTIALLSDIPEPSEPVVLPTTIYDGDSDLTNERTVNLDGNDLNFASSSPDYGIDLSEDSDGYINFVDIEPQYNDEFKGKVVFRVNGLTLPGNGVVLSRWVSRGFIIQTRSDGAVNFAAGAVNNFQSFATGVIQPNTKHTIEFNMAGGQLSSFKVDNVEYVTSPITFGNTSITDYNSFDFTSREVNSLYGSLFAGETGGIGGNPDVRADMTFFSAYLNYNGTEYDWKGQENSGNVFIDSNGNQNATLVNAGEWVIDGTISDDVLVISGTDGSVNVNSLIYTPNATNQSIADASGKILVTKEYADENYSGGGSTTYTSRRGLISDDAGNITTSDNFIFDEIDEEALVLGIDLSMEDNAIRDISQASGTIAIFQQISATSVLNTSSLNVSSGQIAFNVELEDDTIQTKLEVDPSDKKLKYRDITGGINVVKEVALVSDFLKLTPTTKASVGTLTAGIVILDSADGNALKYYNGTDWIELNGTVD